MAGSTSRGEQGSRSGEGSVVILRGPPRPAENSGEQTWLGLRSRKLRRFPQEALGQDAVSCGCWNLPGGRAWGKRQTATRPRASGMPLRNGLFEQRDESQSCKALASRKGTCPRRLEGAELAGSLMAWTFLPLRSAWHRGLPSAHLEPLTDLWASTSASERLRFGPLDLQNKGRGSQGLEQIGA